MDHQTTSPPKDLYKILEEIQKSHFSLFEDMIELNKTLSASLPGSGTNAMNYTFKTFSPLTIFSPDIVTETLQKTSDLFYKKLEENPDALHSIALKHFEKQQQLYVETLSHIMDQRSEIVVQTPLNDRRFQNPAWETNPYFSFIKQHYLLFTELLNDLINQLEELDPTTKTKIHFYSKQLIQALSPLNFAHTNPEVVYETLSTNGENLKQGLHNLIHDIEQGTFRMTDMSAFEIGKTLATTKGVVVFENELLQLIHYEPTQERVFRNPLLIIPAWINKYYLFDLRPENSFVRWCLDHGIDVYIISWVNPDKTHKEKTFCDYTLEGLYKAVRAIQKRSQTTQVNALGNCAGGILLNCLMAYLEAHKISSPFASATTLASPIDTDFLGDLKAFICEAQLKILDESLDAFGVVPGHVLMQSFNLLRPHDLLWSFYIKHYLLGKQPEAFDILFWNCDSVNLPGRMHSQYLRNIFLDNKLIKQGAMRIAGTPIDFRKIKTPSFILGAIKDHIVPWQSVYPLLKLISSDTKEYILVGSGHISGIINPPHNNKYQYWTNKALPQSSEDWFKNTTQTQGSWWPYWYNWLTPFLRGKI